MKASARTAAAVGSAGVGASAAAVATAASACCVGPVVSPLIVSVLGAGGAAWAAGLKAYSPYLLAASAASLAYAFWTLRRSAESCTVEGGGGVRATRALGRRVARGVTWTAAALWLAAVVVDLTLS